MTKKKIFAVILIFHHSDHVCGRGHACQGTGGCFLIRTGEEAKKKTEKVMPPKKRTAEATNVDPSKLTVAQLKDELKKRGCAFAGNKAQLISRLEDALNGKGTTPYNVEDHTRGEGIVSKASHKEANSASYLILCCCTAWSLSVNSGSQ